MSQTSQRPKSEYNNILIISQPTNMIVIFLCFLVTQGDFSHVRASSMGAKTSIERKVQMGMGKPFKKLKAVPTTNPSRRPSPDITRRPTDAPIAIATIAPTARTSTMNPTVPAAHISMSPSATYTKRPESTSPSLDLSSTHTPSTMLTPSPTSVLNASREPSKTAATLVPTNKKVIVSTTKPVVSASLTAKPIVQQLPTSAPTIRPSTVRSTAKPIVLVSPTTRPVSPSNRPILPSSPTSKPNIVFSTGKPILPSSPTSKPNSKPPTGKPVLLALPTSKPYIVVTTGKPILPLSPTSKPNVKPPTGKPVLLASPTSKPNFKPPTGKPILPPSPISTPNVKPPTGKPVLLASPTSKPNIVVTTGKPILPPSPISTPNVKPPTGKPVLLASPTLKPISIPSLSKSSTPIRLDLFMAVVTTRNLLNVTDQRNVLVSLNEGDLMSILQTILSIGYKVNFPLYQEVTLNLYQISQGTAASTLTVSYHVDCQVKFTTTDVTLLPSQGDINNITLASMTDPNFLIFYQFSRDPVLSSVIRTDAKLLDVTNSENQSTNNGGTYGLTPTSTWTFTVVASAVATSAFLVLAVLFIMRRRARKAKAENQRYISSSPPTNIHAPPFYSDTDNASDTNSTRTDDAQVFMHPSGSTACDQSTDFSLNSMVCKSDQGYDTMSLMSVTSDIKLGSVMDVSMDSSKIEGAKSSFSKVWNSDVESNHSLDGDFSKTSPTKSMKNYLDESDDGPSLSYLHVYYGKPSFTLELLGSLDRPKAVDDYSQSEVDVISSSGYANENQSIRSSLYDEQDSHSELSSIHN